MTADCKKIISIVVPFYNEDKCIGKFHKAISTIMDSVPDVNFEVICVNDGSKDNTLNQLILLFDLDKRFKVIDLSRNFGKEAALTSGIYAANGDAVIPIDADLQDPVDIIPILISEWEKGAEVVLARRKDRTSDSFLKRKTAEMFYSIHNYLSNLKIPNNVGDFRLIDRKVVEALKQLPERQRFMKGLFAWVGFKTVFVDYTRDIRSAGSTSFTFWKLWNFAIEGITSFSSLPIRVWSYVGFIFTFLSFLYAFFIIIRTIIYGVDVPGYASLLVVLLFFGGLQLLTIGILGEYIARIYIETKQRPLYIVRKIYSKE